MVGDILQPTHLLLILVVALLVLGPKRLPEVGQKLGSGLRDFRQAINGESSSDQRPRDEPEYIYAPPEERRHQPAREPEPAHDAEPAYDAASDATDDEPVAAVALEDAPSPAEAPPPLSISPAATVEQPPHPESAV